MTSVLDKATAHWAGIRDGSIDVPEWGVTVHFVRPTLRDHARYQKDIAADPAMAAVKLVQERALDAKGGRLFDDELATFTSLRDAADPNVVSRIAQAILITPPPGDAAKN